MTDAVTEGSWVWSDGEPVTYTNWKGDQPNDNVKADEMEFCPDTAVGEDCVGMDSRGWWDDKCEVRGREPGAGEEEGEDPNRPGCYFVQRPYVCSKPAAPATAHGGDMYGCADGHWVLGVAHDGQDLPPTLVRNIAALSAPGLTRRV